MGDDRHDDDRATDDVATTVGLSRVSVSVRSCRPTRPQVGETVGRYRLLDELGIGGMGVVHRAHDPQLQREVALKLVLRERFGTGDRDRLARFVREAKAMAQLAHPNVVAIYDVGVDHRNVYLAMELVRGTTLRPWLDQSPSWQEVLTVLSAAGRGLAAAHRAGLVHRDFKPANVLVGHDGRIAVADFGLARATGTDSRLGSESSASTSEALGDDDLTEAGVIMGTPRYMAPEQYSGSPVTEAADQFAFCAVAYEALYGVRALPGSTRDEIRQSALRGTLSPVAQGRSVPAWLHRIVVRGLSPNPDERHATMDVVLEALRGGPPRAARWGWAVAAAAAIAVGGWTWADASASTGCSGADLQAAWNEPTRSTLQSEFAATGRPHAHATAVRVTTQLDAYAQVWTETHETACRLQTSETSATSTADAQLSCLAQRRAEFTAITEALKSPTAQLVDAAVGTVDQLGDPSDCVTHNATPRHPRHRAAIAAASGELARARVSIVAGRPDRAHEAITIALGHLEPYAESALTVRARYLRGRAYERQHRTEDARRIFTRTYWDAVELGADRVAARSAAAVAAMHTDDRDHFEQGHEWIRHATAALARLDDAALERADLLDRHAALLKAQGDHTGALALRRKALAAAIEAEGEASINPATINSNLGNDLRAVGDLEAAAAAHRQTLALRERILGDQHPDVSDSLVGLAIVQAMRGELSDAEALLRRALAIDTAIVGADSPTLTAGLTNLANALDAQGKHAEALVQYERVLGILRKNHGADGLRLSAALSNSSVALASLGRHDEAEARARRAIAIEVATLGDDHPGPAESRLILAHQLARRGDDDKALRLSRQAGVVLETHNGRLHPHSIASLTLQGRLEARSGDQVRAAKLLDEALLRMDQGQVDPADRAKAEFALAKLKANDSATTAVAMALARAAQAHYAQAQTADPSDVAAVRQWLASRANVTAPTTPHPS